MAGSFLSSALDALTSKKGAVIAGVAMLGLAGLVNIARTDAEPARSVTATSAPKAVLVQAVPAGQPAAPAGKGIFNAQQTDAIQSIVRDYLLKNPELIVEMSRELEARERERTEVAQSQILAANKAKIFTSPHDFVLNPKGDITVVEYFDYNCGWCKRALNDVARLTKADPKVRVVLKEFPIFGADSIAAAKAAMASNKQGKYWEMHQALMRESKVTAANVLRIAKDAGLDVERLKKDMADPAFEKVLAETSSIAQGLKIEGTPAFIVDGKVNVGYLTTDALLAQVAEARKAGCKMC